MSKENIEKRKNKLVLFAGYKCNNNCIFCINSNKRNLPVPDTQSLLNEIYKAAKEKIDILEIIGGEPTIREDFLLLVSTAKKLGIKEVLIATNGRMFSDIEFAKKAISAGLDTIIFSIHGANSKIHNSITRSNNSWQELTKAIENLKKLGFKNINANTTIVKQNMKNLIDIAKFYVEKKINLVEFIFVDPNYGGAHDNFYKQVPKISEAAYYIKKALDYGRKYGYKRWNIRYVPVCHFLEYFDQISEINESELYYVRHIAPDFVNNDVLNSRKLIARKKTEKCIDCKLYNICEGIWSKYLEKYGDKELKPVTKESDVPIKLRKLINEKNN